MNGIFFIFLWHQLLNLFRFCFHIKRWKKYIFLSIFIFMNSFVPPSPIPHCLPTMHSQFEKNWLMGTWTHQLSSPWYTQNSDEVDFIFKNHVNWFHAFSFHFTKCINFTHFILFFNKIHYICFLRAQILTRTEISENNRAVQREWQMWNWTK